LPQPINTQFNLLLNGKNQAGKNKSACGEIRSPLMTPGWWRLANRRASGWQEKQIRQQKRLLASLHINLKKPQVKTEQLKFSKTDPSTRP
jgi:hypothetical protein